MIFNSPEGLEVVSPDSSFFMIKPSGVHTRNSYRLGDIPRRLGIPLNQSPKHYSQAKSIGYVVYPIVSLKKDDRGLSRNSVNHLFLFLSSSRPHLMIQFKKEV